MDPSTTKLLPEQPKRVRRWHHRGFTGCSTCKSRHIATAVVEPSAKRRNPKTEVESNEFNKNEEKEPVAVEPDTGDTVKIFVPGRGSNIISKTKPTNLPASLSSPADLYYSHFINTVSTLLIVYDTDYNLNPYRYLFPKFTHTSKTLPEAMKALGALQIANTTTGHARAWHMQNAMGIYGKAVQSLRQTLCGGPTHW
ncbi:hypothetical protein ACJ72_05349 [Emergomyces africanus]|uniref:Uncharacterized protein n=1 Tax=Emergomyces africanus TaxID=1955775 RepID=A0A1B7NUA4_9EURO|nr:hypothetical protein ACJ72_05349 [Emergomyces africanus]